MGPLKDPRLPEEGYPGKAACVGVKSEDWCQIGVSSRFLSCTVLEKLLKGQFSRLKLGIFKALGMEGNTITQGK